ncbi:MAG: glycoside hydrolase family 13 protein [Candidatus Heritagella sp.]
MFNSRSSIYRCPTGAVADGTNIHFKINLPRNLRVSAASLIVENDAGLVYRGELYWCGQQDNFNEWWECDYTPEKPGLFFYYFEIISWRGPIRLSRVMGGEAVLGGGERWQLTVYRHDYVSPDWLAGGILYQIFPDRFFSSGTEKAGVPGDRHFHEGWLEEPEWRPNERGEVLNKDFFGGDLRGIEEKLPYLKKLGVTCLYLNPIFESHSNHRYDTADYSRIDPVLGTEEDFRRLAEKARAMGIRLMLDGVFSHTGSDSVYFNKEGRYPSAGACQSQDSPYYSWYTFHQWPDRYDCWWGFPTLPNVTETNSSFNTYINGENGICRTWLRRGASAWRLDVADELPDEFLDNMNAAAKAEDPEAVVLGEVWEDASNKSAYGVRRRYLLGGQLDSVMNYPFRDAILGFLRGSNPADMMEIILNVLENYPPHVIRILMNHIGTHDTDRAITALAGEPAGNRGRDWQSVTHMTPEQYSRGITLMKLAAVMQYTLPGVPCVYYGDEAGVQGYRDPFNRTCYPWGQENKELLDWYQRLGALRGSCPCLREGSFEPLMAYGHTISYLRRGAGQELMVAVNQGDTPSQIPVAPWWKNSYTLIGYLDENGCLPPLSCLVRVRSVKEEDMPQPPEDTPSEKTENI